MPLAVSQKRGKEVASRPSAPEKDEGRFMFPGKSQTELGPQWLQHLANSIDVHTLLGNVRRSLPPRHAPFKKQGSADSAIPTHLNMSGLCLANVSSSIKGDRSPQVKMEELKDSAEEMRKDLRVPIPKATVPGVGEVRSLALKQLLCGVIAGAFASFVTSPLTVLRTRVIAGRGGTSTAEVLDTAVNVEGLQSLMKGSLKVTLIATSLQKGVQFFVYEAIQRKEQDKLGKDPKWLPGVPRKVQVATVAGAVAGAASTLVVYPFNEIMDRLLLQVIHGFPSVTQRLLQRRLMSAAGISVLVAQPSEYSSLWGSMAKVVRTGGVSELYRGIVPALMTMIPEAAASFYMYENMKSILNEKFGRREGDNRDFLKMSAVSVGAGAVAGLVASALTYPLEVARKEINMSVLPQGSVGVGGAINYNTLPQAFAGIAQREGLPGFYRGFAVQASQVIPMTALTFAMYEVAKRALVAEREERRNEIKG